MRMVKFSGVAAVALLLLSGSLFAHHGTAGSYDQSRHVTVKGIVKEFRWRNPHSALFLIGKDESGKEVVYAIETGSPNVLVRQGYTRNSMKPGDEVSVQMHPSLANPTNGEALTLQGLTINGKEFKITAEPE
jgi:hypothetical protein